jgi:FtsP/CotA-like multicopper oxidase with cupredoxin domain
VFNVSAWEGAPDGRSREIWGYNKQFPGPEIRAKAGDQLRIQVNNQLPDPTSIHWHGMKQLGTWKMDGVTGVSREPIPAGESFTYVFKAEPTGTHMYHSHTGIQYSEGLVGPLIIDPESNPYQYDSDEVVMISDWFQEAGPVLMEKIRTGAFDKPEKGASSKKSKMKMDVGDVPFQSALFNGKGRGPGQPNAELSTFQVDQGERVRFRFINSSSTYAFRLQFDQHKMTVIECDGQPMRPVEVDNLWIDIGERFDVIVEAKQKGTHWIRIGTLDGNEGRAVLRYKSSADAEPADSPVKWGPRTLGLNDLRSPEPVTLASDARVVKLVCGGTMQPYGWTLNGQSWPKADPIMVSEGESIRFELENPTGMNHPFHLHGHFFHLLGKPGELNLKDPAKKDSITVPTKSARTIEWVADNPGHWFFHCHIEWHLAVGMARVIQYKGL